jgi:carbon monoxide dehydrogenase subunit G
MKLDHSFTVPVGVEDAWRVLLDIERVAPCLPGAAVDTVDGDDITGTVKVKLGPISLTYKGKASFVEKDEAAHRAVIDARGKDARGNGTASAKITATLRAAGDATVVDVQTDLNITGKPAQFGRGVMVDVGNKLLGQFAECLAGQLGGGATGAEAQQAPADEAPPPAPEAAPEAAPEPAPEPPAETDVATGAGAAADRSGGVAATTGPALSEPTGRHSAGPDENPAPAAARTPRPAPEPINLLEHAGPAVAKRVAPVVGALALAGIAVAIARRRRGG